MQGPTVAATARQLASAHTGRISFVYSHALEGFAVRMTPTGAAAVARDARVAYVEPDQVMHAFASQTPATWGLDRIDQRDLPLNNTYTYNQTGAGVNAYIIDTGMRATHQEFAGRVGNGADFVGDGKGTNDCNGHGTHVAGTIGGTTYGVAKRVTLHAVRVLNCQGSGTDSGVIAGIDWVTANHVGPAVANMSLGGGVSSALDTRGQQLDQLRRLVRDRRGQLEHERVHDVAGARRGREHRRRDDEHGRPRVVLELRDVPGSLRAGQRDHVVLEHERHRDEHDQRDLDGDAARDRGDRALPADEPGRFARNRHAGADLELDAEPRHERGQRVAEPAPVLDLRRRRRHHPRRRLRRHRPVLPAATSTADELIVNGGFEGSASPWALSGSAFWSTGAYPHSGTGYSILGAGNNASGSEYQTVSIPSTAAGTYTFWLNITTSEACCTAYDFMYAEVRSTSGALLSTLGTWTNANSGAAGVYSQKSFSLAAWRGQTVRVQFRATTDFSLPTSFRIDDVSLR